MRNFVLLGLLGAALACSPSGDPAMGGRTPLADKWFQRAKGAYRSGDFDDAETSAINGLKASPSDGDLRTMKAKLALSRLDYDATITAARGVDTSDARGALARALWYKGNYEEAADALDAYLRDPSVKDPWASEIVKLARKGAGHHPFELEGSPVAVVEMPKAGHALVVPCELEGEQILAMVATGSAELMIDSATRKDPAWVSLRFADRIEVKDVPALTQDLSALSQRMSAPIKALIGIELLRHLHATIDRRGDQFIVRLADPAPPPDARRMPLWYLRGGAMALRGSVNEKPEGTVPLLIDSSQPFLVALNDDVWAKAGVPLSQLTAEPGLPEPMKAGILPYFKLASFDFSGAPGVQGVELGPIAPDLDLGGVLGASFLSAFRVTVIEEGRSAWMEPDPVIFAPKGAPPPSDNPKSILPSEMPKSPLSPEVPKTLPKGGAKKKAETKKP